MKSPFCGVAIYKSNGVNIACKLSKTFEKEMVIAESDNGKEYTTLTVLFPYEY